MRSENEDDECGFIHRLVTGSVRCGALRQHHSQYTGHEFVEPKPKHCGQLMRYDDIQNGDMFQGQRLIGTWYCEQCCTMQPVYAPSKREVLEEVRSTLKGLQAHPNSYNPVIIDRYLHFVITKIDDALAVTPPIESGKGG